jgi:hypothetical protein
MNQPYLSASDVLSFLLKETAEFSPPTPNPELLLSYRQAASVLASVTEPARLVPLRAQPAPANPMPDSDWIPWFPARVKNAVTLRPDLRREILAGMSDPKDRLLALQANPSERVGPLQETLESFLLHRVLDWESLPAAQLRDVLQVALWLEGGVDPVPPTADVRARLAFAELIAPLENLAGDAIFRGRQSELSQLRSYVGVLPPGSFFAGVREQIRRWGTPQRTPAVSLSGPGGVGKSALVARFLLDHARLPFEERLPFAYLDFDRTSLDFGRPATLVLEIAQQLHSQFPQSGFHQIVDFISSNMDKFPLQSVGPPGSLNRELSVLADLLGILSVHFESRPFIVILDTFEEVQYRGEAQAFPVWDLLDQLQSRWPFLRVVVSGRAPVTTLRLAERDPERLELSGLDPEAAVALLHAQGVEDSATAQALVRQLGGAPLSLRLAATLLRKDSQGLEGFSGRSRFWFSPADEVLQGQLYERILGRIHNPRVERLAHPGLVLRRIDPDIILHVLNEPCRLEVSGPDDARALFEELRKETSLVSSDTLDESLVHRPDLRRIMLDILVNKDPALVSDIRRRAVAWYEQQPGSLAKAELAYQNLQLGNFVPESLLRNHEVRASLQSSIAELPENAQLMLASHGFQIDRELLEKAGRLQAEFQLAAEIEELLPYGEFSVKEGLRLIEMSPPPDAASPLHRAHARLLAQSGDTSAALTALQRGLHWATLAGDSRLVLGLAQDAAWLRRSPNDPERLPALLLLEEYARRSGSPPASLQAQAQLFDPDQPDQQRLHAIVGLLSAMSPLDLWSVFPVLGLVALPLGAHPGALSAVASLLRGEDSPFFNVSLPNWESQMSLRKLLDFIASASPDALPRWLADPESLIHLWPYRVLDIRPPYDSSAFDRSNTRIYR